MATENGMMTKNNSTLAFQSEFNRWMKVCAILQKILLKSSVKGLFLIKLIHQMLLHFDSYPTNSYFLQSVMIPQWNEFTHIYWDNNNLYNYVGTWYLVNNQISKMTRRFSHDLCRLLELGQQEIRSQRRSLNWFGS